MYWKSRSVKRYTESLTSILTLELCLDIPHKSQWREALMFSLICAWINGWVNNGEAGDSRRHRAHYYVTVMSKEKGDKASLKKGVDLEEKLLTFQLDCAAGGPTILWAATSGALISTWFNFDSSRDKQSYNQQNVGQITYPFPNCCTAEVGNG